MITGPPTPEENGWTRPAGTGGQEKPRFEPDRHCLDLMTVAVLLER